MKSIPRKAMPPADELAARLHEDAQRIDASVSPELDARIRASLERVHPQRAQRARKAPKTAAFWWASSLTGAATAAVVIVAINLGSPQPTSQPAVATRPLALPSIEWKAETAVLTSPLEKEFDDLREDLE